MLLIFVFKFLLSVNLKVLCKFESIVVIEGDVIRLVDSFVGRKLIVFVK